MDYTKNLKLSKPSYDDDVDIQIINTNMDMLDDNISNLDYVKNVQTDNNGLTFTKKDNSTIKVPLNYLKLTGGSVKGNTEFTGKLTNNGKIVGQLFDGSAEIKSILAWDKTKEVYGSTMVTKTTIIKDVQKTITYPNWCIFSDVLGTVMYLATGKNIYLTDDFTTYDEIIFLTVLTGAFLVADKHKSAQLNYMLDNYGIVNLTNNSDDLCVYGYHKYGTSAGGSTTRMFKYYDDSCYIVDILGVKYTEAK